MNFYKHHIGDYAQATGHLSFIEDAAYSRLIRKYYAEEKPLPADVKTICRLIGARTRPECAAVQTVLEEFFVLGADGWHNKRCDAELEKANAQADTNRRIAEEREAKKRGRIEHESFNESLTKTVNEPSTPKVVEREPSQTPDSRLQTPEKYQDSEGVPSAAEAAPASPPPDEKPLTARERIWLLGVPLLGDTKPSRSLLGKLAKTYGDEVLLAVLAEATADPPLEPKPWVIAACEARAKGAVKAKTNGHTNEPFDMLADPKPDWALDAGFGTRFEAENEGCFKSNSHQFRSGKRVAA